MIFGNNEETYADAFRLVIYQNLPWILTPHEVLSKVIQATEVLPDVQAFEEIELKYQLRS